MAIVYITNPGGLFVILGKIGGGFHDVNGFRYTGDPSPAATWGGNAYAPIKTIDKVVNDIYAATTTAQRDLVDGFESTGEQYKSSIGSFAQSLQNLASSVLTTEISLAFNTPTLSLTQAIATLINDMVVNSQSIVDSTVTAVVTETPLDGTGTNIGDGVMISTAVRPDGAMTDLAFDETITAICTADAQTGTVTRGQETFALTGRASVSSIAAGYPLGSGLQTTLAAVSAGGNSNLLLNGTFDTFTVADTPDNWTTVTGTPGTEFGQGGSVNAFIGDDCLEITGNMAIQQARTSWSPLSMYAVNFWTKHSAVPGAYTVRVSLWDTLNDTVLQDESGTNLQVDVTNGTGATTYTAFNAFFRTPKALPIDGDGVVQIAVRISTPVAPAGDTVYVDEIAFVNLGPLYNGGVYGVIFSGATPFLQGDGFTDTVSNDYASRWPWLFDSWFNLRNINDAYGNNYMLPVNAIPTVLETLIS